MPLNAGGLADGLRAVFGGFPQSTAEAARSWASLYRTYAGTGTAGPAVPLPAALDAARSTLADHLDGLFARAVGGVTDRFADDLDAAFVAFWSAPAIGFAAPPITGVVTLAPPGVLGPALAAVFSSGTAAGATAAAQAQAVAGALDGWTRTVVVVNTPPGPPASVFLA